MCCIFGFIKWSLSCIHRSLTFILGFWVVATILYALALAIASGVAFGYNYCLAEYKTLARPDVQFSLQSRQYVPEILKRRSGNVAGVMALGDEYQQSSGPDEHGDETYLLTSPSPSTLWLYEPARIQQSFRRIPPFTFTTDIVNILYRMTKTREIDTTEVKEPYRETAMALPKIEKEAYDAVDMSLPKMEKEEYSAPDISLPKTFETNILPKESEKSFPTTVTTLKTTPSPSISTTLKSDTTSSTPKPKPKVTKNEPTDDTWPSHVIRVFVPKSTKLKWRPTKPNKQFFYRTLPTGYKRKTKEDSYHPEMEIRTYNRPSYGKYEGPMRHWDATTKPPELPETSTEDNIYKNVLYF